MQWMESSLQPKGSRFNLFPNCFCQQTKLMKTYIEHLNKFFKLIALRKQLPQGKKKLCVSPKQIALENNVSSQWSKMKFLRNKKIP
jgi:hypothetical protein